MPTYTYACNKCGAQQDEFHAISATPKIKCSACGSVRMKRKMGTGSGIIFKGSGFYETDYKTKRGSDGGSKGESTGESTSDSKSPESKPAAASDSKPAKSEGGSKKGEAKASA